MAQDERILLACILDLLKDDDWYIFHESSCDDHFITLEPRRNVFALESGCDTHVLLDVSWFAIQDNAHDLFMWLGVVVSEREDTVSDHFFRLRECRDQGQDPFRLDWWWRLEEFFDRLVDQIQQADDGRDTILGLDEDDE